jgi:tetratricopeptide (TPR) repeat protein
MYEMLTGKLPFRGEFEQAVIYSIVNEEPEPLSKFIPEIKESFQQILDKMLSKKLEARYQKAADLIVDLKRLKEGVDSGIVLKYLSQKRARKLYGIAGSIALIVVLILLVLSVLFKSDVLKQNNISAHRIAVLPFIVRGGEDLAYLQNGMVDLLSIMLDGAGGLKRVDPYALQSYVSREISGAIDPETGRVVAKHFEAGLYVIGSVHGVGDQVQLSASLYDVESGLKHNFETKRLDKTKIDKLVDDLATQLVSSRDEVAANQFKSLASATTTSYAALKAYLEGENYIRSEKYVPACKAFLQAVEDDTTFALAYYRLQFAQQYTDDIFIDPILAIERALRHTEKLSWRDITLLNATRLYSQKKFKAALQQYRLITNDYPDNAEAWFYLGAFYIHWGSQLGYSIEEARFALNKSLAINPEQPMALGYLSGTYGLEGRFADQIPIVEQRNKIAPDGVFTNVSKITPEGAYLKGDTLLARQLIQEGKESPSFDIWLSAKFNARDEFFDGARNRFSLLFEPGRSLDYQAEGHLSLAHINFAQGKIKAALDEVGKAKDLYPTFPMVITSLVKLTPMMEISSAEIELEIKKTELLNVRGNRQKIARLYAIGLFNAQLSYYQRAFAYADSLQTFANVLQHQRADTALVVMARDRAHTVLAKIYFEQGNPAKAWEELEQMEIECWMENNPVVTIFASLAYERYLRAQILKSQGRYEDAIRWLATLGYVDQCEISYKASRNFLLAEIYEATMQPEKAIEHYNHFINLWKYSDPELQPKVEEAKARIERLKK